METNSEVVRSWKKMKTSPNETMDDFIGYKIIRNYIVNKCRKKSQ